MSFSYEPIYHNTKLLMYCLVAPIIRSNYHLTNFKVSDHFVYQFLFLFSKLKVPFKSMNCATIPYYYLAWFGSKVSNKWIFFCHLCSTIKRKKILDIQHYTKQWNYWIWEIYSDFCWHGEAHFFFKIFRNSTKQLISA